MVAFVEGEGLRAAVRTGGTLAVIKGLVAAGYPRCWSRTPTTPAGTTGWATTG